jgi:hypothetical protein
MGGLVKFHFLIDFWPLSTIPLTFWQNQIQDGGDIRVRQKSLFYLKNSKSEIFQKVFPRFVVLSSTKLL